MASATDCPCETKTSTRRSLATISSGLWRFLGIAVLLFMSKDIPQGGPVQWGWIIQEVADSLTNWKETRSILKVHSNLLNSTRQEVNLTRVRQRTGLNDQQEILT